MTQIDQFESAFKAADKQLYTYERVEIGNVLVISDLDEYETRLFGDHLRAYLRVLGENVHWRDAKGDECESVGELLSLVEEERPDLVCTYRNLHSGGWKWPYSLGEHLDVLTQVTDIPILVVPRPADLAALQRTTCDTSSVMAITNHFTGDHRLINYAVCFTQKGGELRLTHIEAERVFERYIDAISRIASIDTDLARTEILARLLKEPRDYIDSCRKALDAAGLPLSVETRVTLGRRLEDYRKLIEEHKVDLLVLNTKDNDQLAMHGTAYPLAIELRLTPLLML